ncbi:MAG: YqeG family HAD IIIA-type phosphatase [Limnochordales bacterium]|nr:MAG: YqeG family HAD IIIA-type phosphatase [Bacillota bacterium]
MLRFLAPDAVYESLFAVDLDDLKARGIRGLIVDLDNTLIEYGNPHATEEARRWVEDALGRGFKICLTSNARSRRVRHFAREFNIPAIANAAKPIGRAFRRAMRLLGTRPDETAVIGDQVFTDVLGGNRMNTFTVLVNPLSAKELGATRMMRRLERKVLRELVRQGLLDERDWQLRQKARQ